MTSRLCVRVFSNLFSPKLTSTLISPPIQPRICHFACTNYGRKINVIWFRLFFFRFACISLIERAFRQRVECVCALRVCAPGRSLHQASLVIVDCPALVAHVAQLVRVTHEARAFHVFKEVDEADQCEYCRLWIKWVSGQC